MKHRFVVGTWVSIACLALSVASVSAQEPPHGPRMPPGHDAMKPKSDAKPGPMPENRGGPPGFGPGGRLQPHLGGPPGDRMHDMMERRMMHGRDASVPPPVGMSDAGIRRRHRPVLTPEQLAKRNEQLAKLHAKFGHQFLERREARIELNTHAWRIARLQRMRTLAEQQGKPKLTERIDALMKKENERHEARMERLRGGDGGLAPPMHPKPAHPASSANKMGGQP